MKKEIIILLGIMPYGVIWFHGFFSDVFPNLDIIHV